MPPPPGSRSGAEQSLRPLLYGCEGCRGPGLSWSRGGPLDADAAASATQLVQLVRGVSVDSPATPPSPGAGQGAGAEQSLRPLLDGCDGCRGPGAGLSPPAPPMPPPPPPSWSSWSAASPLITWRRRRHPGAGGGAGAEQSLRPLLDGQGGAWRRPAATAIAVARLPGSTTSLGAWKSSPQPLPSFLPGPPPHS
ncbi:uncharacterized protein M6D78_005394 isoform 1-T1 [Vipera latastei]